MNSTWDNVEHFEQLIANYAGSKYAIATDSCSNAIFLSLKYIQMRQPHGVVEVPKYTYPSVPMAVKHAGFEVKFVHKKWHGIYQLSPFSVYDGAVMFTKDMYAGGFHCLSFHIKKHIPIGRGGMILTDNKKAAQWLKCARYDGRPSPFWKDVKDIQFCGWHMYMTPDQAVKGIELFHRLPDNNNNLANWDDYSVDLSQLKAFDSSND
tara:strand:+ start:1931 stop:2551 length:621 start_codon:yes stop_codon:yes gene_type:complete